MRLVVTVDVEEDHWEGVRPSAYTCENIDRIPALQELFDRFGVRPTYLTSYAVATDARAVLTLRSIVEQGRCEIGAHCHPWNTPPIAEPDTPFNSMLCNLDPESQHAKIKCLRDTLRAAFGIDPVSFRCGRYGYGTTVARNLEKLGFRIDTSITPYVHWRSDHGPDFSEMSPEPFRFSGDDAFRACADGDLLEVPVSIGFLQSDFDRSSRILNALSRPPVNKLRLVGILYRLGVVNRTWLSPEVTDTPTMISLARVMMRKGYGILNMTLHSPTLQAGLTPFARTVADEREFLGRVRGFLTFARDAGIEPIKLCDVEDMFPRAAFDQPRAAAS